MGRKIKKMRPVYRAEALYKEHANGLPVAHSIIPELKKNEKLFFKFLVLGFCSTGIAELFEFKLLRHGLFILTGPVIDVLALAASKFDKSHLFSHTVQISLK